MKLRIQLGRKAPGAKDSLKGPATLSMILHGIIFGLAIWGGVLVSIERGSQWGESGLGGGNAVPVNLEPTVPLLPTPAPENPLASATKEINPAEVKPPAPEPKPEPDARELQLEAKKAKKDLEEYQRRQVQRELAQLRHQPLPEGAIPGSTASGRVSSSVYGMSTGQGSGEIGFSGDFGSQYGWYVRTVRECIARHWDRSRIDAIIRSAPRVYVEFDIHRDGTIWADRIATSSGVPQVDREAVRAVESCSGRSDLGADAKLPALPSDYAGRSVHVEVWFEFKK